LEVGDVFSVVASGQVTTAWWPLNGGPWWPEGNGRIAPAHFPFPGNIEFSDILRFNNNPAGWVGSPQQATQWGGCEQWGARPWQNRPVRLLFYVNDDYLGDNDGSWRNTVMIWKASAPA
jgi:hypothetical protein